MLMSEQNWRSDQFWKTLSFTTVCLKCWPEETGWFCKTFSWESRKQTVNCSKIQIFKSEVWDYIWTCLVNDDPLQDSIAHFCWETMTCIYMKHLNYTGINNTNNQAGKKKREFWRDWTLMRGTARQRKAMSAFAENEPYWLDIKHHSEKWLV